MHIVAMYFGLPYHDFERGSFIGHQRCKTLLALVDEDAEGSGGLNETRLNLNRDYSERLEG